MTRGPGLNRLNSCRLVCGLPERRACRSFASEDGRRRQSSWMGRYRPGISGWAGIPREFPDGP
eukprot:11482011-Alexandrium_andersonii.AAC.1